jgi:predicted nuclease with RNAse H fold
VADGILEKVREAASKRLLFLPHTIRQMSRLNRMIAMAEVEKIVKTGNVIEDYPENIRGHSCLILGLGQNNREIHVVCAPKDEYLAIITAYLPDPDQWTSDFKRRV